MPQCRFFTQAHGLFRKSVRTFVEREIVPNVDAGEERGEFPRRLFRHMGELGLLDVGFPPEGARGQR